mgnify:CR=1 FL=1
MPQTSILTHFILNFTQLLHIEKVNNLNLTTLRLCEFYRRIFNNIRQRAREDIMNPVLLKCCSILCGMRQNSDMFMVLIFDGYYEIGSHVLSETCNLTF